MLKNKNTMYGKNEKYERNQKKKEKITLPEIAPYVKNKNTKGSLLDLPQIESPQ